MIRIVCVETDGADALHIGGPVHVRHKTFDIECPALEAWLAESHSAENKTYCTRSVSGVEVVTPHPQC